MPLSVFSAGYFGGYFLLYCWFYAINPGLRFVAALVIPAQALAILYRRGAARRYGSALVAIAVLCAPLAILAVHRGSGQLFWVQPPSKMVDKQVLQSLTSAGLQPVFHRSFTTKALMWATLAAVAALVIDTARRWRRGCESCSG